MTRKELTLLVEEAFTRFGLEHELVDVEFLKGRNGRILRVTIDKPGGIQLADCERVSGVLGEYLDKKDPLPEPYNLEVSSPGVERPLKNAADYQRFSGRMIRVHTFAPLQDKRKIEGMLKGIEGDAVLLDMEGEALNIPLELISKAHLVFRFDGKQRKEAKR